MDEFDIEAARSAGHSDEDIAKALAEHHGYDPKSVDEAFKAGHSYSDIASELSGSKTPSPPTKGDYEGDVVPAAIAGGATGLAGAGSSTILHKLADVVGRGSPTPSNVPPPAASVPTAVAPIVEPPIAPIAIPTAPNEADLVGKELWNKKLTGANVPGSQMDAESLAKNREAMKAARDASGRMQGSTVGKEGFIIGPEESARRELEAKTRKVAHPAQIQNADKEAALQNEARMSAQLKAKEAERLAASKLSNRLGSAVSKVGNAAKPVTNVLSKIGKIPYLGPALAGAGTAGEIQDAINRWEHGDKLRAGISGLGALGSAASLVPYPLVRGIGTGAAMAAPAINTLIDKFYGREGYADGGMVGNSPARGGLNYRDYPNPFQNPNLDGGGLRAWKEGSGYGGEMLPKSTGWLGLLQGTGPMKGHSMTEVSVGDSSNLSPSINPLLDSSQLSRVLSGKMTPDIRQKAMEWRNLQKSKGQSPFYNPPGFAEGGKALLDDPSKSLAALNDFLSMANIGHQNWYKGVMPKMMDKYGKNKIGTQRTEGSPRDAAEEFAGAADYGQRAPADYNRAVDNASLYQRFHNTGKNATENFAQDQAGLALGMCNPEMSKKDIIKQSIQYGLNPADYLR